MEAVMGEFGSIDDILEFAISREVEANEFYTLLADRVRNPAMAELLLEFAKEELEHKAKLELEVMKRGKVVTEAAREAEAKKLADFKMADYMVDVGDQLDMDYEDLLLLAMKKEKVSFRLYVDLAAMVNDEESHEVLVSLAEEEARHKVQCEIEYDEMVLKKK
jgi:rubrerythrin